MNTPTRPLRVRLVGAPTDVETGVRELRVRGRVHQRSARLSRRDGDDVAVYLSWTPRSQSKGNDQ